MSDATSITLKVSAKSNPNKVAGSIAKNVEEGKYNVSVICIGAGAVNQAVKAIAIARGYLAPLGYNLKAIPSFTKINIDENTERTAIKFTLELV